MEENKVIERKVGFVWYSMRISFYIMVLLMIASWFVTQEFADRFWIVGLVFIIASFFTFVTSILHLFKYEKKALAIVALVLSSIEIVAILVMIGAIFAE